MSLSQEQKQAYQEQGFLILPDVVDAATLARLRELIADFKQQSKTVSSSDELFDVGPDHTPNHPQLRRIKHPVKQHPEFDALMRSDAIVGIVSDLLGGTVRFDHSKLNFKPAGGSAKIEWHQDWAFYPHTNDDLLAVGVMIEDCTPENGPLMVIPGSHKGPVYDHHLDGVFAGGIQQDRLSNLVDQAVGLTAPAGSISIHHVRTLHASSDNRSTRERPLLLYSYSAVDAFPVFHEDALDEYDSRILRGKPTRAPRCEAVPMRLPLPRREGADSIFDNQSQITTAGELVAS
ncbi:MAG: phytanoyl-CoA dioxygenase family protein [Rhizobiaceae bacterium]|nr:phytanoyl-CoA dioxygenase family protein [Hyphomicrobiales bacterium]NRB32352.1 phytanoyl-CoA dioxygenase family protein [Rhizobiaceae bacterium]